MNIDYKATVIDVRTPEEFAGRHLPGAINIPLDELSGRIEDLRGMSKPIIAYCRVGNRSGIAVAILSQYGITDAINGGGIDDMAQALNTK